LSERQCICSPVIQTSQYPCNRCAAKPITAQNSVSWQTPTKARSMGARTGDQQKPKAESTSSTVDWFAISQTNW